MQNGRRDPVCSPSGYRALTFDNASRITGVSNYPGTSMTANATQAFTYDNAGRLATFSGYTSNGNASANITQTQSFTYDSNGNRLTSVLNGVNSTYSYQAGNNRLAGVAGGISKANTYDLSGNLTTDATNNYNYDGRGRLVSAIAGGLSTAYLINYQNLRVKKTNSSETRYFVYDDAGHMLGEYDGSGAVVAEYFWLGEVMVAVRGTMPCLAGGSCTETATGYVWADHLNTPRDLTRVNGSNQHVSIWKWDSLPFGETTPNANPSNLGIMTFNHRFPGQYRDQETGLHQNWNREYDPRLGRYITSDPVGLQAGPNTYSFVTSNPLSSSDRLGLDPGGTQGGLFCVAACNENPQAYAYKLREIAGFEQPDLRAIENFFEGFQHIGPDLGKFLGMTLAVCYQLTKPIQQLLGLSETGYSTNALAAGLLGIEFASRGYTLNQIRQQSGCACGGG